MYSHSSVSNTHTPQHQTVRLQASRHHRPHPFYSAFFAVLGLVSTFVGQKGIIYLVERYQTTSLIVFSIALVMVIAVALMTIAGVLRIIKDIEQGTVGFSDFCEG